MIVCSVSPRRSNICVVAGFPTACRGRSLQEDVEHLIQAFTDVRYRTATVVAYGAALRISEVVSLQVTDIRREQGLLHIREGKGHHERMAYLPDAVLKELERYWKTTWPRPGPFFCQSCGLLM